MEAGRFKESKHQPDGPLGRHIASFGELIEKLGYPGSTANRKTRLVIDLDRWLKQHGIGPADYDEKWAAAFLDYRTERGYCCQGEPTTLRIFLSHLREIGVVPYPAASIKQSPLDRITNDFALHLMTERALKPATSNIYLFEIRRFLSQNFGTGPIYLGKLSRQDISRFMICRARTASPRALQLTASALRSYLSFVYQRGVICYDLAASVPSVANWRFSGIPKFLVPEQIEKLMRTCDRGSSVGQRDLAILLLLARLGLRAGDVVDMRLDDIDWDAGELSVRGKSRREDRLPIPRDVGKALAAYIRHGRPRCTSRHIFLRSKAPRRRLANSVCICNVVRKALRRAGLNPPFKGSHLFRHSLATQMLQGGATLAEIGTILRHRLPNTTEIYAKVDLSALRTLAQPWPGGRYE
jgi:site-specific recombinase XerD